MKKTHYTAKFKFDRVIESIKKDDVSEVSRQYGFQTNYISRS